MVTVAVCRPVAAWESAPVSLALMCSAVMIEHQRVVRRMLMALASSGFCRSPNDLQIFQIALFANAPNNNCVAAAAVVAVDMDYSTVDSEDV